MPINFPDAPSSGDTHTSGDKTWTYDGTAWNLVVGGVPTVVDTLTINQDAEVGGILTANHIHGNIAGSVYLHVKNTSGVTIPEGSPVYATGSVGASGETEIAASDASTAATMPALGITQSELVPNAEGHATILGVIGSLDTSTYGLNDSLYVAPGGGLTDTRPTALTDLVQKIGRVVRVNGSTGEILVLGAGRTNDVPNNIVAGGLTIDTDTLHVDSTNNRVGIGTTSPNSSLHIDSGSVTNPTHIFTQGYVANTAADTRTGTVRNAFDSNTDYGTYWTSFRGANGGSYKSLFGVRTGGTDNDVLTVDSSGNVGINDTTPSYTLDVNGDVGISSTGTAFDPTVSITTTSSEAYNHAINAFNPNLTANEGNIIVVGKSALLKNSGYVGWLHSSDGSDNNLISLGHWGNNWLLNVAGNGNVGIGYTTPSYKLDVNGDINSTGTVRVDGQPLPQRVATGVLGPAAGTSHTATFPSGRFTSAPIVAIAPMWGGATYNNLAIPSIAYASISTTGFTMYAVNAQNGGLWDWTYYRVYWIAIQM